MKFLTPGHFRSGHQVTLTDLASKKVCNRVLPAVFVTEVSNLVDYMTAWVPLTCISWILYICDLRSGQRRDLSIISEWRKTKMPLDPFVRVGTVQIVRYQDDLEQPRWSGYAFLANSLLKGHQRSLEATNSFLSITLD